MIIINAFVSHISSHPLSDLTFGGYLLNFAEKQQAMHVNMIVASGRDGAIGKNGDLIWHISSDLKRFKTLTTGHPVIMGRKTWESLPRKPLPGRLNIVLTRNKDFQAEGAVTVHSVEEALELAADNSPFIMGGAEIYKCFLPYVTKIYLTEINRECPEADAFLNIDFNAKNWKVTGCSEWEKSPEGIEFRYIDYLKQ